MNTKKHSLALYIIGYETAPNFVIRKAFEKHFSPMIEYDWYKEANKIGLVNTQKNFLNLLKRNKPEYTFMQIQSSTSMSIEMIREMAKYTKIINWTGDLKATKEWYDWLYNIGKEIFLTLFTNETDVNFLRGWGVRADYLQVAFDHVWYDKRRVIPGWPEIIFCANHYTHYPLSDLRLKSIQAMKEEFGDRFGLFGAGWQNINITAQHIDNKLEAEAYNSSKIALSISSFNYERYHSDRLYRIMACGNAVAMSHQFSRMEEDFIPDKNLLVFKDVRDLVDKCKQYMTMDQTRQQIANNAYNYVHTNCRWDSRCKQLIELLTKYEIKVPSYQ